MLKFSTRSFKDFLNQFQILRQINPKTLLYVSDYLPIYCEDFSSTSRKQIECYTIHEGVCLSASLYMPLTLNPECLHTREVSQYKFEVVLLSGERLRGEEILETCFLSDITEDQALEKQRNVLKNKKENVEALFQFCKENPKSVIYFSHTSS